jgi:hypothetical protein
MGSGRAILARHFLPAAGVFPTMRQSRTNRAGGFLVIFDNCHLLNYGLVKHIFRNTGIAWFQQTDKIDDVYDFGMIPLIF